MSNSDSIPQSGNTPPITTEFIEQSLARITRTLNELTTWKQQVNNLFS